MAECKKRPPVTTANSEDDSNLKTCCICCEEIKVFAVGSCDHVICYRCSARMRVLSKQTYCATCRAEMKEVVISFHERKFNEFNLRSIKIKRPNGFFFEDRRLSEFFDALFDYACIECSDLERPFSSLDDLRTHIRRAHDKQFCQICLDALSNFPSELKMYTKKELVSHRKEGDVGDRSHRGHPECKFCSDRFVDNDTLLFHLRKSHFWCHFCEHDGKQEYYDVYKDLRFHFGEVHFLCDEGECRHEKFTSVFRDKIDFQAHKLAAHGKNFNKIQAKEARKIEFDYSYRKRQQPVSVVTGSDYAEVNSSEPRASSSRGDTRGRNQNTMDFSNFEDVEMMRQDMKKEKGKVTNAKPDRNNQRQEPNKASNVAPSPSAMQANQDQNDEDIIGMPVHLNKKVEKQEKAAPEPKNPSRETPVLNKAVTPKPEPPKVRERVMEDFPSLPGGLPSPNLGLPRKKTKEEDFPALGKPVAQVVSQKPTKVNKPVTVLNGIPVTVKKKKEKGKSWTQQSGRANMMADDDFPSLHSIDLNQNVKDNKSNYKSLTVISKKPIQEDQKISHINKMSNGKPPPGLNGKPPPGFNEQKGAALSNGKGPPPPPPSQGKRPNGKGPPGFSSPSSKRENRPPGFGVTTESSPESNMRERNMRLVALLETYLDDFNLQIFKNVSGEFRREILPAFDYYSAISELLGENLRFVFSELVALLPDEKRREELLKAHQNAKVLAKQKKEPSPVQVTTTQPKRTIWGSNPTPKNQNDSNNTKGDETWCQDCGLTFLREEMLKHMESHGEAFPSLPTAKQKKNKFMPFKQTVHQSQTKNAWGR